MSLIPLPSASGVDATSACQCTPADCASHCSLEVVDNLLRATRCVCGEEVDGLLDLRCLLHRHDDAEATVAVFCELRRAMERQHYLEFYRLRRWLENHVLARIRLAPGSEERTVPLKLDRYCVAALRHACLVAALEPGERPQAPQVRLEFRTAAFSRPPATLVTEAEVGSVKA